MVEERRCLVGMGFGRRLPIDVVGLYLAGLETGHYTILLADEFLRLNGVSHEETMERFQETFIKLRVLGQMYSVYPNIIPSSTFMMQDDYGSLAVEMMERIRTAGLEQDMLDTVPEHRRHTAVYNPFSLGEAAPVVVEYFRKVPNTVFYPLHEITCVEYLRRNAIEQGDDPIQVKVGPRQEQPYDRLMALLGMEIEFAYLRDAFAFGTPSPAPVVPYIPTHRNGGQRIYLDDPVRTIREKLRLGPDEALRPLLHIASVAGARRRGESLPEEDIDRLYGRKLARTTDRLVMDNIVTPYKEVVHD